ncbi:hypothetical protein HOU45_gp52 [Microbacterium phage Armstrong]|uniref:Uncharacterized protein n=3 Tax=Armstrongvirus armstrong TaxID=2734217 RepID=A0A3G2KD77_9CAUD|nr:hypothetical protein HOU45_gp52 [Microbacterium phage Armstrong]AYN56937.1 hypothetical protein PBI_ARMSTRONG_52 [Microbacterium phage Armstrong]AYN57029.1 hypothetical protein PBI_BERNSTEIN_52 [Microbacterium phage Bernstein]AYN58976.1 hypothetical protein PBI_ROLLINS_52 [Microbacterium phage Rollins]UOK18207.1 hypothetical protein SEA_CLAYDA5_54 [Microbacterium phage Clayda5]
MNALNPALDAVLPLRTHGALPSSRTEDQTVRALESDNIDEVKAQLAHVWAHYQSLEFIVNAVSKNLEGIDVAATNGILPYADAEVALRVLATEGIEGAYQLAHATMDYIAFLGMTPPDAVRAVYAGAGFDFSDPEREGAVDKAISDILAATGLDDLDD